jgi:N-acetylglucosaminyldiphosphoundecaprenol N-acetyl-beta-D-mannosaminyltransferase
MPKKIKVMDIRFDNITLNDAVNYIFKRLYKNKKGYLCTPNPEMLLEAEKNKEFKKVLNGSVLNIPDGIGILWAANNVFYKNSRLRAFFNLPFIAIRPKKFNEPLKERVTGVDLVYALSKRCCKTDYGVFLLGAKPGVAELAAENLEKKFPGLKIKGTFAGSPYEKDREEIINLINTTKPDILFVAYGAPKQEVWISDNLKSFNTVKIAVGVGGAFDFISKTKKRAPRWMQKSGLEWFYRLIQEPSRIKRILRATVVFPYRFIRRI